MNDPSLNNLLKWGVQNSAASRNDPSSTPQPMSDVDKAALMQLLSGVRPKSDAEVMDDSLDIIEDPEAVAESKYEAFKTFETIVQQLDNANNLENKERWTRLAKQLKSEDPTLRMWAAHSCGTAVQNNIRTQERILVIGAIPDLVQLATTHSEPRDVRKKAITALSSTARNFQPGLDAVLSHVPKEFKPEEKLDANDMESVDILINKLRDSL